MVVFVFMEVWKKIEGFENYMISNYGNVKGIEITTKFGISFKKYPERIIKQWRDKKGYSYVTLSRNKEKKNLLVHRLVGIAFIKNKKLKPQINHINGIKSDNNVNNLEWSTAKENLNHARKMGLNNNNGIKSYASKFNEKDILFIRKSNLSQKELSIIFNVSQTTISRILLKKTYKDD